MKRFFSLLLLTTTLTAYDTSLDWRDLRYKDCYYECLVSVEGAVGAILWKPCGSSFQYGNTQRLTPPEERQLIVNPEYQWGFQIFAGVADPSGCYFANVDWTYLNPSTSTRFDGPDSNSDDLFLLNIYALDNETRALTVFAKQNHHYNKVSLKGGHTLCQKRCGCFYTYVGGRYVQIKETREVRSLGTGNLLTTPDRVARQHARLQGGGVEAGLGGNVEFCYGFGLRGHVGAIAVIARQESSALKSSSIDLQPVLFIDPIQTVCTGALEVRAGVYGSIARCGVVFDLEIGYELDYYFQALRFRQPLVQAGNLFTTDIGFGGPYISLGVSF